MKYDPKNTYKVSKRQWKKWTFVGRHTFNMLYNMMITSPHLYQHPQGPMIMDEHFKTTAWNAAWMAADITSRGEKYHIKELMKELGV